jgi:hypothetical protein
MYVSGLNNNMISYLICGPYLCLSGHINNQYNTCFWMLVKSGKSEQETQLSLKVV